ncbi:DUF2059 domain-containing protein [Ottowia oryzae]
MNTRILVRRVGVAFALLGALAAHAEPASEAAAQELLKVSQAESMLTAARANLEQQMRDTMDSMLAQEKLDPAQREAVTRGVPARVAELISKALDWPAVEKDMVQVYRDNFTEEVAGQIAFYRSSVGQSVLDKMPAVMQQSTALAMRRMQTVLPQMKSVIEKALAEAKVEANGNGNGGGAPGRP